MPLLVWTAAAVLAAIYTAGVARGRKGPLKVVPASLLAVAMWSIDPLVAVAMAFCAVGDAFLLDKDRFFLHGLGAFLVAHLLLVPALFARAEAPPATWVLVTIGVAFAGVLAAVLPRVRGSIRMAIPLYALALAGMLAAASAVSALAFAAAAIFAVSDSLIAINRFVRPFAGAELAISVTYKGAILLLTWALLTPAAAG